MSYRDVVVALVVTAFVAFLLLHPAYRHGQQFRRAEFILYTRDYEHFCRRAFGAFLHHTPAVVLAEVGVVAAAATDAGNRCAKTPSPA